LITLPIYVGLYNLRLRAACREAVDQFLAPCCDPNPYVTAARLRLAIFPELKIAAELLAGHADHVHSINEKFRAIEQRYLRQCVHVCEFGLLPQLEAHSLVYRSRFLECAGMSDEARNKYIDSLQ
jgi:hypothetical protein